MSQPGAAVSLGHPVLGEYVYRIDGWEETALPGSRRSFPATGVVVVHSPQPTSSEMQFTFDLTYIPGQHEERVVASYGPQGVAATFEAGRVSFFGVAQTSEAAYSPAFLRTPFPASPGQVWSGTSEARDPGDGSVKRVERYRGTVLGTEVVDLGAGRLETLVAEWQSEFSGEERGTRYKKMWLAPQIGMWVRWHERLEAERFNFTYREEATFELLRAPGGGP